MYPPVTLRYSHGSEHLVRFALRHESRRVFHGDIAPGRPFRRRRLDSPSHRHKRKVLRHEIIHRDHKSLFRLQWARCCVIQFCLHSVVRMCRAMTICVRIFSSDDRDMRVWNHHRCVCVVFGYHPHAHVRSRVYDTITHVIRCTFPNICAHPLPLCRPSVHHHVHHDLRLLTTILYHDMDKISTASSFPLCWMFIVLASVMFKSQFVSPLLRGDPSK